jgi:putative copper export protein
VTVLSTTIRATHLLTNAAWFGGSLMGAVGLNPASRQAGQHRDRVSGEGWERWGPVQGAAIGLHLASGLGILADNRRRTALHRPTRNAVLVKTALTGAALAASAAAYDQGKKLGDRREGTHDAGEPVTESPRQLERRLSWLQWAVPAATGGLLVLDAYLGEQQRGTAGLLDRFR